MRDQPSANLNNYLGREVVVLVMLLAYFMAMGVIEVT